MIRFPAIVTVLALSLCASLAAPAQLRLTFEAVSIKPSSRPTPEEIMAGTGRPVFNFDATHLDSRNFPLTVILARAFQVDLRQISAPDFANQSYFEVLATAPPGTTREQLPEMLQAMLADRFKLTYHRETRDYPTTVVTVGKGGIKLARLPDDTRPSVKEARLGDGTRQITLIGKVSSLFPVMGSFGGFPQMDDETGLDGIYTWVVNESPVPGENFQETTHEAYKTTIEAAGLRLEQRKLPKETIVIDHLEKTPTEN